MDSDSAEGAVGGKQSFRPSIPCQLASWQHIENKKGPGAEVPTWISLHKLESLRTSHHKRFEFLPAWPADFPEGDASCSDLRGLRLGI